MLDFQVLGYDLGLHVPLSINNRFLRLVLVVVSIPEYSGVLTDRGTDLSTQSSETYLNALCTIRGDH